jgi:hypothetical protein
VGVVALWTEDSSAEQTGEGGHVDLIEEHGGLKWQITLIERRERSMNHD